MRFEDVSWVSSAVLSSYRTTNIPLELWISNKLYTFYWFLQRRGKKKEKSKMGKRVIQMKCSHHFRSTQLVNFWVFFSVLNLLRCSKRIWFFSVSKTIWSSLTQVLQPVDKYVYLMCGIKLTSSVINILVRRSKNLQHTLILYQLDKIFLVLYYEVIFFSLVRKIEV